MKKIHIIRHAKSSWDHPSLADIDRPLNKRGISTCCFMAPHIAAAGCCFENTFCSPAARAQSTIELISEHLPGTDINWQTDERLYTFDSNDLITWLRSVDESLSEILIIGHNPALTDVCNDLSDSYIDNIPTCGYVQLVAGEDCYWPEISETAFQLSTFLRPKQLLP